MVEKLGFGLAVTVICMSIVFLVLIGLSYVIRLQRAIVEKIEGTASKPEKAVPAAQPSIEVADDAEEDGDKEELVAVITAAVAAALGRPTSNIVVRSIVKLEPAAPSWTIASRQDQMNSRF